jgi:glycosyltransferase involved in cell wall biosynthesis
VAFFSIVMPTYNRAHLLPTTIQSIIGQTFDSWELIVVDDGSTDNTREVIDQVPDNRIRYTWQAHAERSAARNTGLEVATGEFICFVDSDDVWHPDHLAHIYDELVARDHKPALYFTSWTWVLLERAKGIRFADPTGVNLVEYVIENQIAPSAACIHKGIAQLVKFNPALSINEDVEYFARVASAFDLIQIPAPSVDVISHSENTSAQMKDWITPQIRAMKLIFNNSDLAPKISAPFKRRTLQNLRRRLIEHHEEEGDYGAMAGEIALFVVRYPFAPGHRALCTRLLKAKWLSANSLPAA